MDFMFLEAFRPLQNDYPCSSGYGAMAPLPAYIPLNSATTAVSASRIIFSAAKRAILIISLLLSVRLMMNVVFARSSPGMVVSIGGSSWEYRNTGMGWT